ncbi:MAG: diguanylate cyclase [Gammaproteobacteria bacterium]|nr:diguanylate cyclase [Gammaproteobacteria bacterium]
MHPDETARQQVVDRLRLAEDSFDENFDRIIRVLRGALQVPVAAFSLIDGQRQLFKSVCGLELREIARAQSLCGHAILGDGPLVIEDTHADQRFCDNPLVTDEPHIRFYAGMPVRADNRLPVGALCAIDHRSRRLESDQRQLLCDLAALLEDALRLRSLSVDDTATGLYNRRFFDDAFDREWRRAQRSVLPLSVLLIELDHLQHAGWQCGVAADAHCLQCTAALLKTQLRRGGDLLARYGSGTFAALLPDLSARQAMPFAERLCAAVRGARIAHAASPHGAVTTSIGGASVETRDDFACGAQWLLARADNALRQAMSDGRDRVMFDLRARVG